ncbi:hypothetical protein QQF64_018519 [Cirrhinus molitorella]|uniref:ribonuclease H n=1 Tax=Cirrhinus molitorella TaxID=172907 RepID=A0ABR3LCX4_9TELE
MLLFAIRETVQESLGFSPAELVFGHTVRGPLKLLREQLLLEKELPVTVCDYVSQMRQRLHQVGEIAKSNLALKQVLMKERFDRNCVTRSFQPGDLVLVLLPLPGSAPQARFSGPYVVEKILSETNYLIRTPEHTPTQTHVLFHDIKIVNSSPIKQHPYRVNPQKREEMRKEVGYLLTHGLAVPSLSAWSSPCLLVPKPDGSFRFCTDYRKVNSVTKPDSFPLPRMEDCVDRVGASSFVTKLDLLEGYWQVPLTQRASDISAFVTPDNFLQYTVMAFGMRNAPAAFQRLMQTILSGVANCEAYLDDVVVYSSSWSDHMNSLHEVFARLAKATLTVNLKKCEFRKAMVTYLELLSMSKAFVWSPGCDNAFNAAKDLLCSSSAPDFLRPFKLEVNASALGAGAVLLQETETGIDHPVCFFSKKFSKTQQRYSTIEKEALALLLALQHFEVYVGGSSLPITVYTDHNPLVFLLHMANSNQRLMRWSLVVQS